MNETLELLTGKREEWRRGEKLARQVKVSSLVVLVFYCLVSAGVFSYWLFLGNQSQTLSQKITLKEGEIKQLQETESLEILLKQRLSSLKKLFSLKKLDYEPLLTYFERQLLPGVLVSDYKFSQDGEIDVNGTAENAIFLTDFLVNLTSQENDQFFEKITLTSASRDKDGVYSFGLKLAVK